MPRPLSDFSASAVPLTPYGADVSIPVDGRVIAGFRATAPSWGVVMGSVFGRAIVVAGAVVVALGSAAGVAAATPRPPALAFTPSPFD